MPTLDGPNTLSALVARLAAGKSSPSEAVTGALESLDRTEPDIRAWVRVDRTGAPAAAREQDSEPSGGPLRGIPFGVKDIIDVRGTPTECGSPLRRGRTAESDAPLVARLRQLGAIPLGKTVTTEFAYFSPGPTRNPHNPGHTPGGSSSGSAAAVAAGVVPLALGSQTAGSLTRPAAYCGVAGFVAPVGGPLHTGGFAGLAPSLDAVGLLTPSVADLRLVYEALTADRLPGPLEPPARPRLALWSGSELAEIAQDMQAALIRSTRDAVARGAVLVDVDWPARTPQLVDAHTTIMAYEAARELATEAAAHPDQLSTQLNELLAHGRDIPTADYRQALALAERERAALLSLLTDVDAVLGPAAPGPAPRGLTATGSPVLSRPWQLLGLPTLTVPGHRDSEGMPLGLQLIGHPDRLDQLFALGHAMEQSLNASALQGGSGSRPLV